MSSESVSDSGSGFRVLMTKNWKKDTVEKNICIYLIKNCNFIKDVQATGEAFGRQKRTSNTLKDEIYYLFIFFWVIFALPDLDSGTPLNPGRSGQDPQHRLCK
jgi:hypothetical protein